MPLRTNESQAGVSLVELLVGIIILSIVTTMIIMSWTSLQNSYSSTVKGAEARSTARDAMERMRREIRDIQPPVGQTGGITQAGANEIRFTTAFNDPGSDGDGRILLTRYYYSYDGTKKPDQWRLIRQRDTNNDGSFTGDPTMVIARNVVNGVVLIDGSPTPVFEYFRVDRETPTTVLSEIATVQIHVISDLNPAHSPTYFDLMTTVQPRNLRPQ